MNDDRSVVTIGSPEFIDIHPFNPLISECQIKVMYIGKNRNGSYIDKDTAIKMANSLPGCPIVGYYREDKEDFRDHGEKLVLDGDGIQFLCQTKPYGFVGTDAKVWFQKFNDEDEFGNTVEHEYMMTTGYLWTGQYQEAMSIIEDGKGQSMELDSDSVDGHWANDTKTGMEFFIINDALFSKLCVLGDDVEPCFEGASISATNYALEDSFVKSLRAMKKELEYALGQTEGGPYMPEEQKELQEKETDFTVTSAGAVIGESATEDVVEEPPSVEESPAETAETVGAEEEEEIAEAPAHLKKDADAEEEFAKKDDKTLSDEKENSDASEEDPDEDKSEDEEESGQEDEDKKKAETKHSLAEDEAIMAELAELREFKLNYERAKKDEVINKYHMLSDEDKADVVAHKDEYSLEQIDEKLALVYVRKNVDFSTVDGKPEADEAPSEPAILAFSLNETEDVDNAEPVDSLHEVLRELFN